MFLVAAVEVAEEVDADLDAVVEVVALAVIIPMMRIHRPLLTKVLLKEMILGIPQKDVVMVDLVDLVGLIVVVVAVEALAMVKLVKMDVHGEHLNVTVGLDEEMNSSVMVLDVGTGVHSLMILLR